MAILLALEPLTIPCYYPVNSEGQVLIFENIFAL